MIDTRNALGVSEVSDDLGAAGLLASIRSERQAEDAAAARQLDLAARWADLHPPESVHHAAAFTVPGFDHEEPIAGAGCPLVTEFCIPELGAVLGISTTAAKKLIGHALELRHRLPRLWDQVHAGRVPAWRARLVAETTIHTVPTLTVEAAGWIDAQVAAVAGKVGTAQLDRLVAEAIKRYDLSLEPRPDFAAGEDHEDFAADQYLNHDARHVTFDTSHVHYDGLMRMEAELDLADAYDLDAAIQHGAAALKALGSTAALGARRAAALGDLARTQTALDLHTQGTPAPAPGGANLPAAREVVLHVHLDAAVTGEQTVFGPTARLENGQRLALLDQVKTWCTSSRTKVTIRPVLDLNADLTAETYAIPDLIREQVVLRDRTCVFPWCTRPARVCDLDHVVPFDHDAAAAGRPQPGPTATSNLAPLCRSHHRLKTHTAWRYVHLRPGVFEWTSPHDHHYLRDRDGTTALNPPTPPQTTGPPRIPQPRRP
ncbi:HNH endonuclease signature motif containing protein [Nocardioides zeicaulis]|uniref:HNH endonuclease signature motif containing protein n=1 Tax=Nocardioides zeicaulis TaxID=1776857 RepID=A0ABV6DW10_9ACTN